MLALYITLSLLTYAAIGGVAHGFLWKRWSDSCDRELDVGGASVFWPMTLVMMIGYHTVMRIGSVLDWLFIHHMRSVGSSLHDGTLFDKLREFRKQMSAKRTTKVVQPKLVRVAAQKPAVAQSTSDKEYEAALAELEEELSSGHRSAR